MREPDDIPGDGLRSGRGEDRGEPAADVQSTESLELPESNGALVELANVETPEDHAQDHALIRAAQKGEEAAFEALVRRHQQRAWRVARNLVGSDEDAQDLAQEAFVRVFKNLHTFDFAHGFTTWLYRIVTNLAIDHLRKRRPVTSTTRNEEDESDYDLVDARIEAPSDRLEKDELADEVKATLASLAPHFQSVLVLREMEGLPCNTIADIVGATHVTVRWRLHRGRKLFQEEWERRMRLREAGGDPNAVRTRTNPDSEPDVEPYMEGADGARDEEGRNR